MQLYHLFNLLQTSKSNHTTFNCTSNRDGCYCLGFKNRNGRMVYLKPADAKDPHPMRIKTTDDRDKCYCFELPKPPPPSNSGSSSPSDSRETCYKILYLYLLPHIKCLPATCVALYLSPPPGSGMVHLQLAPGSSLTSEDFRATFLLENHHGHVRMTYGKLQREVNSYTPATVYDISCSTECLVVAYL